MLLLYGLSWISSGEQFLTLLLEKAQPPVKLPSSLPSGQEIPDGPVQITPTFIFMIHINMTQLRLLEQEEHT